MALIFIESRSSVKQNYNDSSGVRALVVECLLPHAPTRAQECRIMAESIGYEVIDAIIQKRKSDHHTFFLGPGKMDDVKISVDQNHIDMVIFANTLPSSQIFKVQRKLGGDVKVIDRNLLILEVFEKRAMTKEAKLQIKLAKLKYTLSWGREFIKLKGIMGEQLGWMGPGDYPFQEYYRAARSRISRLQHVLEDLHAKKDLLRARRKELGFRIVALAGYTQAGKTTFFNCMAEETKNVGLGPFTTLSTFARRINNGETQNGRDLILIDSIGFIEEMHPIILKAFNPTFSEITNADLILLFVDVSEPPEFLRRRLASVDRTLRQMDSTTPLIVCANKIDAVPAELRSEALATVKRQFPANPVLPISVETGENLDALMQAIAGQLESSAIKPLTAS